MTLYWSSVTFGFSVYTFPIGPRASLLHNTGVSVNSEQLFECAFKEKKKTVFVPQAGLSVFQRQ